MNILVGPQVARSGKGLAANRAHVRLLLDVGHSVVIQVAGRGKSLAAGRTFVWLVAAVDPSVRVEAGGCREGFPAAITDMRPLARVSPDMSSQQRRTVKRLSAERAGKIFTRFWHRPLLLR